MSQTQSDVIEFYGETCPHCATMKPIVEQIEAETGKLIQKLEVWNNEQNRVVMEKYADIIGEACGGFAGVPAFVNTKTNQALCGAHNKVDIINLMDGGDCKDNVCMSHTKMEDKPNAQV